MNLNMIFSQVTRTTVVLYWLKEAGSSWNLLCLAFGLSIYNADTMICMIGRRSKAELCNNM